ncbi:hypothetical protein E5Q_02038 [Mixia osmundae IAM 14324]|uniref:Peptide N-acetyl-beta-D-glucosaminyl asparaginase amidase A N-terminal domain-containing protein n=1 Tax=Mixia osmundae (strain CBS 9802 / IAM 14324 / JCM 22182 / KY 12970) TaxID=764103 RepID=G7DXS4_MIXOS|nr:hypothetical protein E5Q_02038 [Mixia osmundae IAM 14324]
MAGMPGGYSSSPEPIVTRSMARAARAQSDSQSTLDTTDSSELDLEDVYYIQETDEDADAASMDEDGTIRLADLDEFDEDDDDEDEEDDFEPDDDDEAEDAMDTAEGAEAIENMTIVTSSGEQIRLAELLADDPPPSDEAAPAGVPRRPMGRTAIQTLLRALASGRATVRRGPAAQAAREAEEEEDDDGDYQEEEEDDAFGDLFGYRRRPARRQRPLFEPIKKPLKEGVALERSGEFGRPPQRYYASEQQRTLHASRNAFGLVDMMRKRETTRGRRTFEDYSDIAIPNTDGTEVAQYGSSVYCGQYSEDGSFFYTCAQDFKVRIYDMTAPLRTTRKGILDTSNGPYRNPNRRGQGYSAYHDDRTSLKLLKTIRATHECRWTITDANLSPDNSMLIHSTIGSTVSLIKTRDVDEGIESSNHDQQLLKFGAHAYDDFGIWSIRFSGDAREIVAGASRGKIFVYDVEAGKPVLRIRAHDDDVNAVCFADSLSSNVLISGSDDGLAKVWDRRSLGDGRKAGVLVGHTEGLTFVAPKGDGRYVLSNGKDSCAKLWDLRKMYSSEEYDNLERLDVGVQGFDYRFGGYTKPKYRRHPQTCEVTSFTGHSVTKTLIRAHFSPIATTGQRYIYSGSADGRIHIWSLDGQVVQILDRRKATPLFGSDGEPNDPSAPEAPPSQHNYDSVVRDVSWAPFEPTIISTSWESSVGSSGSIAMHEWKAEGKHHDDNRGIQRNWNLAYASAPLRRGLVATQQDHRRARAVLLSFDELLTCADHHNMRRLVLAAACFVSAAAANRLGPRKLAFGRASSLSEHVAALPGESAAPYQNVQVTVPPLLGDAKKLCDQVLLDQYVFANSFYTPAIKGFAVPSECGALADIDRLVLELTVRSIGTQYDRLSNIFINDIEVLRTSTAEPIRRPPGITWTVTKDITRYLGLIDAKTNRLVMHLNNLLDASAGLDGVYNVTLSLQYYSKGDGRPATKSQVILPLGPGALHDKSQSSGLFVLPGESRAETILQIPETTVSLLAEIYASGAANEEFWYASPVDELVPEIGPQEGNHGPFREVQLHVDSVLAGVVWPFAVIYTGGISPALWRPIAAYGAFDAPSYWIDLSPFIPTLVDGRHHSFEFKIIGQGPGGATNSSWLVSGNLQAFLSPTGKKPTGRMISTTNEPIDVSSEILHLSKGESGAIVTAKRDFTITAELDGLLTTFHQNLTFTNKQIYTDSTQIVIQDTGYTSMSARSGHPIMSVQQRFPLHMTTTMTAADSIEAVVKHGYESVWTKSGVADGGSIKTEQMGVSMLKLDPKTGRVTAGTGNTTQTYRYQDATNLYTRDIEARNLTIVRDETGGNVA